MARWTTRQALAAMAVLAAAGAATAADAPPAITIEPDPSIPVQRVWDGQPIPPDEFEVSRLALEAQVRTLVASGNYADVLRQVEADGRDGVRLSSGIWRSTVLLGAFRDVLAERARTEGGWGPLLTAVGDLAGQRPTGWLLYANALYAQAWAVRGTGFAHEVSPEAMNGFRLIIRASRDTLDRHKAVLAALPDWYALRLDTALETGDKEALRSRLFVEGMLRFPRFHPLYFARIRQLMPQWGGGEDQMLDMLDQIARSSDPAVAEEGLYARVAWLAAQSNIGLMREPRLDGAAFDRAVDAVIDRYPAQRNLQRLFLMQCQRGNGPALKRLLPRLKPPMSAELVSSGHLTQSTFEDCQAWAAGKSDHITVRYWTRRKDVSFHLRNVQEQPTTGPAASQRQERADSRLALQQEVEIQVSRNEFGPLMDRYARDARESARLPGGEWRSAATLMEFQRAILARAEADGGWRSLLSSLRDQAARRPAVSLLLADALRIAAWTERGGEQALTPSLLAAFHRRMREARDVLDRQRAALATLPDWHTRQLAISHDLAEPDPVQRRLFAAGVARFPRYHALYTERLRQLSPQWGGNEDAMLALLDEVAAAKDPGVADEGLYARLVVESLRLQVALFGEPGLNAGALNRAVDLLVEREPVQHNLQSLFLVQCIRNEQAQAMRIFPMLKRQLSEDLEDVGPFWGHYRSCLDWAGSPKAASFSFSYMRRGQHAQATVD